MKKLLVLLLMFSTLIVGAQLNYPGTKKEIVTEDYHGTKVDDPYRWLEDDWSDATKE